VDDDPLILRSLQRTLTDKTWQLVCVNDPQSALREIDRHPVDIVLSDMQMHEMSGATLLGAIQQRHPDVVRIILSGESDDHQKLRAVQFAHQFLAKPADPDVLRWTIRRACGLRRLLTNPAIRSAVGGSNELPVAPATYLKLQQALRSPDVSPADVAGIVERDVGLSARLLQLVSSAFFGLPKRVTTVAAAVSYLGVDMLRTLVLTLEIVRMFRDGASVPGFSLETFQRRAFLTAKLARGIADDHYADDAFVGGMLHAIGQLVLACRVPVRYAEVLRELAARPRPLADVEREVLGTTHAEVGGYLLGLWGLPQRVVEAVTHYHEPWRLDASRLGIAGAVYLGSALAERPDAALFVGAGTLAPNQINGPYLDRVGVLGSLSTWRALARRAVL
jgi:HD-like signal output (HDOD) protein